MDVARGLTHAGKALAAVAGRLSQEQGEAAAQAAKAAKVIVDGENKTIGTEEEKS